jgi:hypothetical protein
MLALESLAFLASNTHLVSQTTQTVWKRFGEWHLTASAFRTLFRFAWACAVGRSSFLALASPPLIEAGRGRSICIPALIRLGIGERPFLSKRGSGGTVLSLA